MYRAIFFVCIFCLYVSGLVLFYHYFWLDEVSRAGHRILNKVQLGSHNVYGVWDTTCDCGTRVWCRDHHIPIQITHNVCVVRFEPFICLYQICTKKVQDPFSLSSGIGSHGCSKGKQDFRLPAVGPSRDPAQHLISSPLPGTTKFARFAIICCKTRFFILSD